MASGDIEWDIGDDGHLFRYPSQWDPTSKTCGGYLKGKVTLPMEMIPQDEGDISELSISVSPDYSPDDQEKVRGELGEQYLSIHPAILKVVRKKDGRRNRAAEPMPNNQHGIQEFSIRREDGKLLMYICNKTSDKDDPRNIPDTSFMFELKVESETVSVKLGGGKDELMLVILLPKTDARAKTGELNVSSVLRSRAPGVCDELTFKKLRGFFEKADSRHTVRLVAKVFKDNKLLGSASSPGIPDTADKSVGALNVSKASPLFSCDRGGTEITMVSAYKNWQKSVIPTFYLKNRDGSKIAEDSAENRRLVQPKKEEVSNDGKSLSFPSPSQPHMEDWQREGMQLYLRVKREDGMISPRSFPFKYVSHATIPPELPVCFHDDPPEERYVLEEGVTTDLPKHTGPKLKRQILCKEKSEAPVKVLKTDSVLQQTTVTEEQPEQEPSENVDEGMGFERMSTEANMVTYPASIEPFQQMGNEVLDEILALLPQAEAGNSFPEPESAAERTWTNLVPPGPESYLSSAAGNINERSLQNTSPSLDEFLRTETQGMLSYIRIRIFESKVTLELFQAPYSNQNMHTMARSKRRATTLDESSASWKAASLL